MNTTSIVPVQNVGSESPRIAPVRATLSIQPSWFTAESVPSGIEMQKAIAIATIVSSAVTGKAFTISPLTGRPRKSDWPRSPWTTPRM